MGYIVEENKWSRYCQLLNSLTQSNSILWEAIEPIVAFFAPNEIVSIMYKTNHDNNNLLLFKKNIGIIPVATPFATSLSAGLSSGSSGFKNVDKYSLLITDNECKVYWEIPVDQKNLDLLFNTVIFQLSGALELYNKLDKYISENET